MEHTSQEFQMSIITQVGNEGHTSEDIDGQTKHRNTTSKCRRYEEYSGIAYLHTTYNQTEDISTFTLVLKLRFFLCRIYIIEICSSQTILKAPERKFSFHVGLY